MKETALKIAEALAALGDSTSPAANKVRAKLDAAQRIIAEADAALAEQTPPLKAN